ncbi:MAG: hypothetical protein JO362_16770 [Streptomycetaceae bacterium]|nr:hypothetical protein [Streptomycetaceae bacterium]
MRALSASAHTRISERDEDLRELKETAVRKGVSEAELIRRGVKMVICEERHWDEPAGLPILDSGDPTFAERADEILRQTGFDSSRNEGA